MRLWKLILHYGFRRVVYSLIFLGIGGCTLPEWVILRNDYGQPVVITYEGDNRAAEVRRVDVGAVVEAKGLLDERFSVDAGGAALGIWS